MTIITQVGGIIYGIAIAIISNKTTYKNLKRFSLFTLLYLLTTFFVIPYVAPIFGREKITESKNIKAHSLFYILANRNYVKPQLNKTLKEVSSAFSSQNKGLQLVYLDANFPFMDNFPLLPHLSHNDGKKIDVSLIYETKKNQLSNNKKSISGYGVFENPKSNEINQNNICKSRGKWQYDFPKYLTLGTVNNELKFSEKGTKALVNLIVHQNSVGKLFIEPHLKNRMGLNANKIRFHGCQAVRHDDHIHFQLK